MSVSIEWPECANEALPVTLTRGDRLAIPVEILGTDSAADAARLAAWTGADWLAQVRATHDSVDVVAEFEVTEVIEDDLGLWTFVIEDTDALEVGETYVFDFQIASGGLAPYTYFPGSTIYVAADVSREVGS